MSSRTITRKRSRAQFNEEDELASEVEHTPLSNAKRKKANLIVPSSASKPTPSSIKQKLGGFLGLNKPGKQDDGAEAEDELADGNVATPSRKKAVKDIFDVPSSPEEEKRTPGRSKSVRSKATSSTKKSYSTTGKSSTGKQREATILDDPTTDIYDVLGDEPAPKRGRKHAASAEKPNNIVKNVRQSSPDTPKRKPGRPPRKSEILKHAKQLSNKAARETMMAEGENGEDLVAPASWKGKHGAKKGENSPDIVSQTQITLVARKSGRAIPGDNTFPNSATGLKSVLTPNKIKGGRPRKSVAFEEVDELDLGFKDIPNSISAKKSTKSKLPKIVLESEESDRSELPVVVDEQLYTEDQIGSEDDDDLACNTCSEVHSETTNPILLCDKCGNGAHMKCSNLRKVPKGTWLCVDCASNSEEISCGVCAGLKYTKKNPIILCDGCDTGIHLNCSDMTDVPKGDWFCQECKTAAGPVILKDSADEDKTLCAFPNIEGFETHIRCLQRVMLDKLTGQKRLKLIGHEDEMQKVYQVVEQTIVAGEGNSMLVIGARGCGKTTLVEQIVSDLSQNHRENFHVVHLNGFIHTDDKLALKEIWRQLGREMQIEEENTGKNNYADTLASLLALLSHPSEISSLESNQTAKSVIFILDEFDLFTTHSRQTLLYNLFDIAQARKAPIVVLGLTTRVDVVESLEKRVKSRFSHRYVHLSLPRSLPAFWEVCKEALTAHVDELDGGGTNTDIASRDTFMAFWQNMVEDLYKKDEIFKLHIQSQFERSKSVPAFFTSCILPIASISASNFPLTGKNFRSSQSLAPPDSKLQLLQGLSELEIALLIAAARLDIIQDTDTCNFAMAYDEYSSLTSRHKIQTSSTGVTALGASAKVWGKDVALGAWERLADYDLLVPAGIGGGAARDFSAGGRMWKVDVGLEEITGSVDGLSTVMTKWCREI